MRTHANLRHRALMEEKPNEPAFPENETVFMWFVNVALFFMTSVAVCIFYMSAQIVVRPKSWWKELPYLHT